MAITVNEPGHLFPDTLVHNRVASMPNFSSLGPIAPIDNGETVHPNIYVPDPGGGDPGHNGEGGGGQYPWWHIPQKPGGGLGGPPPPPSPNPNPNPNPSPNPNGGSGCTADPVTCALISELQGGSSSIGGGQGPYGYNPYLADSASIQPTQVDSSGGSNTWVILIVVGIIAVVAWHWFKHRKDHVPNVA